jgi:cell division protein FtsB
MVAFAVGNWTTLRICAQTRVVPETSASWLLPLSLLLFAIIFVPLRMLESEGLPRYRALRSELQQTRDANARTRRQVSELQRQVARLRNDPEALERIARDELGMLRNDEIVFQFQE